MQNLVEAELAPHNHLVNWSNTHECHPKRYYEPESVEELERIVAEAHEKGETLLHHQNPCTVWKPHLAWLQRMHHTSVSK